MTVISAVMNNRGPRKSALVSNSAVVSTISNTSTIVANRSGGIINLNTTKVDGPSNIFLPDYSTDYDSEVARLNAKETHVNSSDTEDASEDGQDCDEDSITNSFANNGGPAIKEQVYLDKLEQYRTELKKLDQNLHPEFLAEYSKVQKTHAERERANEIELAHGMQIINNDFIHEQRAALREFEEKKTELKESLLMDLIKQKELIESERYVNELTTDNCELKPTITRKLRRRPNDPVPVPEKRRKAPQSQITFLLEDNDISQDLSVLRNGEVPGPSKKGQQYGPNSPNHASSKSSSKSPSPIPNSDTRIEDGKLFYEKRWFHRGQPIYLEGKEMLRIIGVIGGISQDAVWVRKVGDNSSKLRVPLIHLMKGKCTIKRRA